MNATDFIEQIKLNKPSDVDCYYSLSNSYTSASFDSLRDRHILARKHYYDTLSLINAEMKEVVNKYTDERTQLRKDCKWMYSIQSTIKNGRVYYSISAIPEYVVRGDEEYYKGMKYQQFFIVNNVVITMGGGWEFSNVHSGDQLSNAEVEALETGNIPERFTKTGK